MVNDENTIIINEQVELNIFNPLNIFNLNTYNINGFGPILADKLIIYPTGKIILTDSDESVIHGCLFKDSKLSSSI